MRKRLSETSVLSILLREEWSSSQVKVCPVPVGDGSHAAFGRQSHESQVEANPHQTCPLAGGGVFTCRR